MPQNLKKWLSNPILILIQCLAITFILSNITYHWVIRDQHYNHQQIEYFQDPETNPRIIILGDSRVAFGLTNRVLTPDIVNFASPGENLRQTLIKLKYAIENKKNVEAILIATDQHMTAEYRQIQKVKTFQTMVPISTKSYLKEVFSLTELAYYKALLVHQVPLLSNEKRFELTNVIVQNVIATVLNTKQQKAIFIDQCRDFKRSMYKSWVTNKPSKKVKDGIAHVERKFDGTVFHRELYQTFDKILQLAFENEIKIVSFTTPQTAEYTAAAEQILDEPQRKKQKIGLLKIQNDPRFFARLEFTRIFEHRPELFDDPDHLNPEGAKEFSKALIRSLKELGLVTKETFINNC